MLLKISLALLFVFSTSLKSMPASAADAQSAQVLKDGIAKAQSTVDQAIQAVNNHMRLSDIGMEDLGLPENDAMALPILLQASSTLFQAGQSADQAVAAFLAANIAFGNYRFSMACLNTGLARSQVARANIAALQPPAGFLVAFSPDLGTVVTELILLRATVACP